MYSNSFECLSKRIIENTYLISIVNMYNMQQFLGNPSAFIEVKACTNTDEVINTFLLYLNVLKRKSRECKFNKS